MRPRIALATWSKLPDLAESDRALQGALTERGADALATVWDAPRDWTAFDAVVIRSCWDYHRRHDEFLRWIAALENAGVRVMNSPRVIRWNSHKGYLDELAEQGIPVVPTISATHTTVSSAVDEARRLGWRKLVVKPAVSASAEGVMILDDETSEPGRLVDGDYLVQPFIDELSDAGEIDLVYLGDQLSHAVRRGPRHAPTSISLAELPVPVRAVAERVLTAIPDRPVYARIDLVVHRGEPLLMEVELIEPDLFLTLAPHSATRLAAVVLGASR